MHRHIARMSEIDGKPVTKIPCSKPFQNRSILFKFVPKFWNRPFCLRHSPKTVCSKTVPKSFHSVQICSIF